MTILARIHAHGGEVIRDGLSLRVRPGRLGPDALAWIKANRERLLAEVWDGYDAWVERAAIREFMGGEDRATAEAEAYREVAGC